MDEWEKPMDKNYWLDNNGKRKLWPIQKGDSNCLGESNQMDESHSNLILTPNNAIFFHIFLVNPPGWLELWIILLGIPWIIIYIYTYESDVFVANRIQSKRLSAICLEMFVLKTYCLCRKPFPGLKNIEWFFWWNDEEYLSKSSNQFSKGVPNRQPEKGKINLWSEDEKRNEEVWGHDWKLKIESEMNKIEVKSTKAEYQYLLHQRGKTLEANSSPPRNTRTWGMDRCVFPAFSTHQIHEEHLGFPTKKEP